MISSKDIAEEIIVRNPNAAGAIVTGSSVLRPDIEVVKDIDVVVFDSSVPEGSVSEQCFKLSDFEIDVSVYHPLHFVAIARNPMLTLAGLREIRKCFFGEIIFDSGVCASVKSAIQHARMPEEYLRQLHENLTIDWVKLRKQEMYSIELFKTIELAFFLRFNSNIKNFYFKHKFLYEDAKKLNEPTVSSIIKVTTGEHCNCSVWNDSCRNISEFVRRTAYKFENIQGLCRDMDALLASGKILDCVLVARYVLLRSTLANNTEKNRIPDSVFDSIELIFLVDKPIITHFRSLFDELLEEISSEITNANAHLETTK